MLFDLGTNQLLKKHPPPPKYPRFLKLNWSVPGRPYTHPYTPPKLILGFVVHILIIWRQQWRYRCGPARPVSRRQNTATMVHWIMAGSCEGGGGKRIGSGT